MTKDEILNMPAGREINVLIAEKVMGWEKDRKYDRWIQDDGSTVFTGELVFSEDIAAAWMAVEKLMSRFRFELSDYTDAERGKHWRGYFWKPSATPNSSFVGYIAADYSAPLAICRAALSAVIGGDK